VKKIHQFLLSTKRDAHKRKLVPFFCLTVYSRNCRQTDFSAGMLAWQAGSCNIYVCVIVATVFRSVDLKVPSSLLCRCSNEYVCLFATRQQADMYKETNIGLQLILIVLMLSDDRYVVLVVLIFLSFSFSSCKFVLYYRPLCMFFCTNFVYKLLLFINTARRFIFRMRSSALSDCFYFILFSLVFFSFSLHGTVVSELRALLHP